ncbi:MAG: DUF3108 domain-containing protein [Bacteroidia bacterium]|nr:DUF3108 domain-containing protein [Bacteroidia bacterium]
MLKIYIKNLPWTDVVCYGGRSLCKSAFGRRSRLRQTKSAQSASSALDRQSQLRRTTSAFHSFVALATLWIISLNIHGQCYTKNIAFQPGEKIYYDVYYNWGFIWLHAAEAYFEVTETELNGKNTLKLYSYGKSLESYDWIFKVRDYYESYIDDSTSLPYKFVRHSYEGGWMSYNLHLFDYEKNKIYSITETSDRPYHEDTLNLPPCTFDMQAAVYYARNIDYSKYKPKDKIPISMIVDNELVNLYIKYLGKDTIETKTGVRYSCIIFTALMMEGSIFKGGEDVRVWVTDDKNKIPVLIEASILVGSVKAYLSKASGLRNKFEARITESEE